MSGSVALMKTTSDLASIRHIQGVGKSVRRAQLTVEDEVVSKKSKQNEKVSVQEHLIFGGHMDYVTACKDKVQLLKDMKMTDE